MSTLFRYTPADLRETVSGFHPRWHDAAPDALTVEDWEDATEPQAVDVRPYRISAGDMG
tara:strand:- start:897 stop:1073 length:177 start_codon:yes stop_codon:yes gene_type:complete